MLAMLGMVALLVLGCLGSARDESRAHLRRWGARSRALRVRGVGLGPIVRRGGGGGRRGGERRALHDPIFLKIVLLLPIVNGGYPYLCLASKQKLYIQQSQQMSIQNCLLLTRETTAQPLSQQELTLLPFPAISLSCSFRPTMPVLLHAADLCCLFLLRGPSAVGRLN